MLSTTKKVGIGSSDETAAMLRVSNTSAFSQLFLNSSSGYGSLLRFTEGPSTLAYVQTCGTATTPQTCFGGPGALQIFSINEAPTIFVSPGRERGRFTDEGLTVTGFIRADGVIYAKFQDVAEWVSSTEAIEPGSVVIVADDNHVSASTEAYDTRVAGVVSAQPGIVLGESGPSKVLVATTGRVKVRVDASNGPIRAGDILVSSPVKGTAMKSEPLVLNGRRFHQPATVIGKALENLPKGKGEILVLLSMQ